MVLWLWFFTYGLQAVLEAARQKMSAVPYLHRSHLFMATFFITMIKSSPPDFLPFMLQLFQNLWSNLGCPT